LPGASNGLVTGTAWNPTTSYVVSSAHAMLSLPRQATPPALPGGEDIIEGANGKCKPQLSTWFARMLQTRLLKK
jgi:hypothetical protein